MTSEAGSDVETAPGTGGGRHRATAGHGRAPAPARPGSRGPRLDGLDLARGLAVLSMLVAHLSPVGGILDVSEYLTAPLFAVVIGAAMGLALARPRVSPVRFVVDNALRGVLLVLVGVVLQEAYAQIDVVLPYLGVLVLVLAPVALLLRPVPLLSGALVLAGAVLGPIVTDRVRGAATGSGPLVTDLLAWTATGTSYRLVSFLPMALAGLLLAHLLPRLTGLVVAGGSAVVLLAAGAVVHAVGAGTVEGAAPYSGSTAEVLSATLLATGTVAASFALVILVHDHARAATPVLAPLLAVGRLALTAYVLQVLVLAAVAAARDGARDDTWPILLGTGAVVVGACWALDRFLGTGPLEVLVRAARLPERGRHGGTVSAPAPPGPPRSRRGPGSPR